MSSFVLCEVQSRDELDTLVDVIWTAFHNPYRTEFQALHPTFGASTEDRETAVREDKERTWQKHISNPASYWIYVIDSSSGDVLGGTEWLIYQENPFPEGPKALECTWYPEGEAKNFVTSLINQVYAPRQAWMNKPHIAINQMAVHPNHRRCGIGKMLMDWGIRRADELELEGFVEASASARFLYEQCGFRVLTQIAFSSQKENPSDEWRRLASEYGRVDFYTMWRPVHASFGEEGNLLWQLMRCRKS